MLQLNMPQLSSSSSSSGQRRNALSFGPREMLQFRRTVRRSSSMAGLPPLTKEQEEFRVQELMLQKAQPQVTKCDLEAPYFETKGGQFPRKVVVEIRPQPDVEIRYTVERVDASTEAAGSISSKSPTTRSPLYRKPFVLDAIGTYIVRAVAFRENGLMQQKS